MSAFLSFRGRLLQAKPPLALPGQRIGLLGGSFNPPHAAHLHITQVALKRLGLDRVWWIITPGNPLKSTAPPASLAQRMELARAIARDRRIEVAGFEAALNSAYTAETLTYLAARYPGTRFVWIMGADNLAGFHRWRNWRAIARLMPFAVVDRPGWRFAAHSSPAARALGRYRVPETKALGLARMKPPAWVFLTSRLMPLSSTELRGAPE